MSEYVESGLEELLPVFELLVSTKLFTRSEVEIIVSRCRASEYALQKRVKRATDFRRYAAYLVQLWDLITSRRKSLDIWEKKDEVSRGLSRKVESLLGRACERFRSEIPLWLDRIAFAKQCQHGASVSKLFNRLLQVEPSRADLWAEAAEWEFTENDSIENARALLQRGLRGLPRSPDLWTALLRLELRVAAKLLARQEFLLQEGEEKADEDPETKPETPVPSTAAELLRVPVIVFNNAVEELGAKADDRGDVVLRLLRVVREQGFAKAQASELLKLWLRKLPDSAALIVAGIDEQVAARDKAGDDDLVLIDTGDYHQRRTRDRFGLGLELFSDARDAHPPSLAATLSLAAANFVLDMLKTQAGDSEQRASLDVLSEMGDRCLELIEAAGPSEETLTCAVGLGSTLGDLGLEDQAAAVLRDQLKSQPDSVLLWSARLQLLADAGDAVALKKALNKCARKVPPASSLPLWELGARLVARLEPAGVGTLLAASQKGAVHSAVRAGMKRPYIAWATASLKPKSMHQLFLDLEKDKPTPLDFYTFYIDYLAKTKPKGYESRLGHAYSLALVEHGSSSAELWLGQMGVAASEGEAGLVSDLHGRALRNLRPDLVPAFTKTWALLKAT